METEGVPKKRGGRRPGAGRPKNQPIIATVEASEDAKAYLLAVMNDNDQDMRLRVDAAKALLPYQHKRIGDQGKKDERQDAAKKAGAGKFKPAEAPKLVVSNG